MTTFCPDCGNQLIWSGHCPCRDGKEIAEQLMREQKELRENKTMDIWDVVERHDDDNGDIYYEAVNYFRDCRMYMYGASAKTEIDRLCKLANGVSK